MKATDDYKAKLKFWAANPQVVPLLPMPPLPSFRSKKFNSYEEMNRWKDEYLLQIARESKASTHG